MAVAGLSFSALPFTGPISTGPVPGGSGIDPIVEKLLDAGSNFLGRVQDRKDASLAARLNLQQAQISNAVLSANASREAGFANASAAGSATASPAINTNMVLIGGLLLGAVVLLRK